VYDADGNDPVSDDESLFRCVSEQSGWYDPTLDRPVAWTSFRPRTDDETGLSVWRARYKTPEDVVRARARAGNRYYVLELLAGKLRKNGIVIEPTPTEGGPGHASLTNLNATNYKCNKDWVRALAELIANELVERVHGPFGPYDAQAAG